MKIKNFFNNVMTKRQFRWYLLAIVSFIASLAFALYNLIVGIIFRLVWNFSVSFYYLFLMLVKAIILYNENKYKNQPIERLERKRLSLFKIENIFLFLIDLALITPIILLLLQEKRAVNIGMIPTIATAAYTTYKIIMACVNYSQSKKTNNLALHGLKIISLKEAIVSIITLQNTMIFVFGNASDMLTLTTFTSLGMYLSIVAISIAQLVKVKKT